MTKQISALIFSTLLGFSVGAFAVEKPAKTKSGRVAKSDTAEKSKPNNETYQALINKAQNLTLQRDRLQASQVLIRGIKSEQKGSVPAREMMKALEELSTVFYTDKAQSLYSAAEAQPDLKAKEAIDQYQEALRLEENNVTILKAIARTHLRNDDCSRAETVVTAADAIDPYSAEVQLLRLQTFSCSKRYEALESALEKFIASTDDSQSVEKFTKPLQLQEFVRKKDIKKARALQAAWEKDDSQNPEVFYWKWRLASLEGTNDRTAAVRYVQLCQNMTPRQRKSYILDVDLCKQRQTVDRYLKGDSAPNSPE